MTGRYGQIKVEYDGRLPEDLWDQLGTVAGVRVVGLRPLTLVSGRPDIVLNQIMGYLADKEMRVRRVVFRDARVA